MVREVSVCKEAEAEVEADEADAADEAVEVSSEALLAESRLESSTLAMIRPTITTTIRAGPAQLQIFLLMRYFRFVLPLFGTPFFGSFSVFFVHKMDLLCAFYDCNRIL